MKLVVANGPNLNLLGKREPELYGHETLAEIEARVRSRAAELDLEIVFFQTNHEGEMLDRLQAEAEAGADGIILNGAGLTHQSIALYDCLKGLGLPVVEVHVTNLFAREPWRAHSHTAAAAVGVITGLGSRGYLLAMEWFVDRNK